METQSPKTQPRTSPAPPAPQTATDTGVPKLAAADSRTRVLCVDDSLDMVDMLAEHVPQRRMIAFNGHNDPGTREASRRAGAWELVSRSGEPTDIILAIRRVASRRGGPKGSEDLSR